MYLQTFGFCILLVMSFHLSLGAAQARELSHKCEYPRLGYFRVLDDYLQPLRYVYELDLGYIGHDRTEEAPVSDQVGLRGNLLVIDKSTSGQPSQKRFEVAGTPEVPSGVRAMALTGKLSVGRGCQTRFSVTTEQRQGRSFVVDGNVFNLYKNEKGLRFRAKGVLVEYRDGNKVNTTRVKLVRFRE